MSIVMNLINEKEYSKGGETPLPPEIHEHRVREKEISGQRENCTVGKTYSLDLRNGSLDVPDFLSVRETVN